MKDDELVESFETGTLAPAEFHHRDHLRLTWIYLTRLGRRETERRLLDGLRALAVRIGKPDKFDAPLTLAWVAAIDKARAVDPGRTFEELIAANPHLLERSSVRIPTTS
jgi:hypothetical protein